MEKTGLFYIRFMDDWVVLSPTRWKLRRAIATVNRTLDDLKLRKHPDKTFIGRIAAGFDFLGYHFRIVEANGAAEIVPMQVVVKILEQPILCSDATVDRVDRTAGPVQGEKPVDEAPSGATTDRPAAVARTVVLVPAQKTLDNFFEKLSRLYEQGADFRRAGEYLGRWWKWLFAGFDGGGSRLGDRYWPPWRYRGPEWTPQPISK